MGYLERLRTEARAVDIVGVVACGLLCLLLFDLMLKFAHIDVFRADDLRYMGSYDEKFVTEGRWLNWLFFSTLRLADVKLVACASVLCFAVFSLCVFRNFLDCVSAALATLVCLFIPPVHLLNEWPLTSFLTFVLLALAGLLRDKMRMPAFFLVFGVLFNGVLSHFYFLLPLLFIGTLHRRHLTLAPPLVKIITWWILGFVIGFACAELAVFLHTGDFIKLSDWRKPHYIHSLSDLVDNVKRAAIYLLKHVHFFSKTTQVLCMAAILNAGWKWLKGDRHATWILVLLLLIAVSAYAQTIPAGIHIELRNTTCLFLAIITLIFFSFCNKKPPLVACAILVSLPLYQHNVNNIDFLGSIMRVWETELEKIPVLPQSVEGIVLIHSTKELKRSEDVLKSRLNVHPVSTEEGLGKAWAWISVPYEVGFRRIHSTLDKDFLTKIALDPGKVERFERCGIYEYAVLDNWLLVRFAQ